MGPLPIDLLRSRTDIFSTTKTGCQTGEGPSRHSSSVVRDRSTTVSRLVELKQCKKQQTSTWIQCVFVCTYVVHWTCLLSRKIRGVSRYRHPRGTDVRRIWQDKVIDRQRNGSRGQDLWKKKMVKGNERTWVTDETDDPILRSCECPV